MCGAVLFRAALFCVVVKCAELYCVVVICLALYSVWSWLGLDLIVLIWIVLSCRAAYILLYGVVLWCTTLYYAVLCYAVL